MSDQPSLTAETAISVYTRHSPECAKKDDRYWKRCKCRKWLYIYEGGKAVRVTAKTRSWEKAEKVAQVERDRRDPAKRQEVQRIALRNGKNVTVADACDRWLASRKQGHKGTAIIYERAARRIKSWAADQGIENLADVDADRLDKWKGLWGEDAGQKYNQIGVTGQSQFLGFLKRFFRYVVRLGWLTQNPAQELPPIAKSRKRTQVLSPGQFQELLAAVSRYTAAKPGMIHGFAAEFRALFLLQRWSGMRIIDCLTLPRTALVGSTIRTIPIKTRNSPVPPQIDCDLPPEAVEALRALPQDRKWFLPGYFLWNRGIAQDTLTNKWTTFIAELNKYLDLRDEQGNPMRFHSHMLRDTYAVELLLAGVPLEDVSKLLCHSSIKTTEEYYGHWVPDRLKRLKSRATEAMNLMRAKSPEYFGEPSKPISAGQANPLG